MFSRVTFSLLVGLSSCFCLNAQDPTGSGGSQSQPRASLIEAVEDTLDKRTLYTTALDFYHLRTEVVDSLNILTHQYDPARRERVHFAHLGNLGSAARPHLFEPIKTKGFDFGHHQYDLYKRRFGEFKFYDTKTPMTEFDYSQGIRQLDAMIRAKFGKNFAKGIKLSLDYNRINQAGLYQRQRAKHTAFGVGLWYDSPSGFYDGLYHYSSNSIVQQDNGGVINYDTIAGLPDPIAVPVNILDGLTTHRERRVSIQNHFHLTPQRDSTKKNFLIDLIHTGQYTGGLIKFHDTRAGEAAEYYGDFLLDDRGARQYMFFRRVANRADVQFRLNPAADAGETIAEDDEISSQLLLVGLEHRYTNLDQEPDTWNVNELFLNASTRLSFTRFLDLRAQGWLALAGQAGDFQLDGALRYTIPGLGRFEAIVDLYSRTPTVLERRLFVSQQLFWDNDFDKPYYSRIGGAARLDGLRLYAYAGLQVIGNHIYFDRDRRPVQVATLQDVWQAVVSKEVSVGAIGLQATVVFQEVPDFLALPTWIGQAQFYYSDFWFRNNMQVRTGVDFRVTSAYDGASYFPLTGQFHLSDLQIDQYPALDIFFDFQVKESFRAYFKVENASAWFIDDIYAQTALYPQFQTFFRFGLWLKLFN